MEKLYCEKGSANLGFLAQREGKKTPCLSKTHSSWFYVSNIFYSFSFFVKERCISVRSYAQVKLIREILSELEFDLALLISVLFV